MIISHKYRFIFIHITKCAGTSITHALLPILGDDDIVLGCTPEGEELSREWRKKCGLHKHSTAKEIRAVLGEDTWRRYYKFSFVRNPWDIQVSTYHWWLKTPWRDDIGTGEAVAVMRDFEEFVLSPQLSRKNCIDFLREDDDQIIVDFIGRNERLDADFEIVRRILSLPGLSLQRKNATRHRAFAEYYNPLTRDLVGQWFRADREAFGYGFGSPRTAFDAPVRALARKPEWLIVHCCHHRVATVWFARLLRRIAMQFDWKFQSCAQSDLDPDTDIFLQNQSEVTLSELRAYKGSHIIRDPRDIIVSGYFYHRWCKETFYTEPRPEFDGRSYQEILCSVSQERGIAMEIEQSQSRIQTMVDWKYDNPEFIEIRFEDFIRDEGATVAAVCRHYGLDDDQIESALRIVGRSMDFETMTGRKKGIEDRTSHFRKGRVGDWRNYFSESNKRLFKEIYVGVLTQLGYEMNENW